MRMDVWREESVPVVSSVLEENEEVVVRLCRIVEKLLDVVESAAAGAPRIEVGATANG